VAHINHTTDCITNCIAIIALQSCEWQSFFLPWNQTRYRLFQAARSFKGGCFGATVEAPSSYARPSHLWSPASRNTERTRDVVIYTVTKNWKSQH